MSVLYFSINILPLLRYATFSSRGVCCMTKCFPRVKRLYNLYEVYSRREIDKILTMAFEAHGAGPLIFPMYHEVIQLLIRQNMVANSS